MRRECPEVMTSTHGKYGTVVTMTHVQEDVVDGEGIEDQPNEVDMSVMHLYIYIYIDN